MGRSKRNQPLMNKQFDVMMMQDILSSNKSRETKMRELSQLYNGNKRVGTMQAKQIFENYQRQQNKMGNLDALINSLDPNTKKMFQDIQNNMDPNQFQNFLTTIHDKLKDPEELTRFLSTQFKQEVKEVQEEAELIKDNKSKDSIIKDNPSLNEPVAEEMIMDMDGNVVDEATDIKESDLPSLSKDEYDFLNSMMRKK